MTGEFTSDQLEIRAMARDFAAGEIRPHSPKWDAARELDNRDAGAAGAVGFAG